MVLICQRTRLARVAGAALAVLATGIVAGAARFRTSIAKRSPGGVPGPPRRPGATGNVLPTEAWRD
jgi:hypothetical protein